MLFLIIVGAVLLGFIVFTTKAFSNVCWGILEILFNGFSSVKNKVMSFIE